MVELHFFVKLHFIFKNEKKTQSKTGTKIYIPQNSNNLTEWLSLKRVKGANKKYIRGGELTVQNRRTSPVTVYN